MQSSSWLWIGLPLSLLFAACRFGFESQPDDAFVPPIDFDGAPDDAGDETPSDGRDGTPGEPDGGPIPSPADAGMPEPDAGQAPPFDAGMSVEDAGTPTFAMAFEGSGTSTVVGGTGGATYVDSCPQGYAIVGYRGYTGTGASWVMRLAAICAEFTIEGDSAPTVRMGATMELAEHGADGDVPWQRTCPTNHVIVGFAGRTGQYLDQLTFRCAELIAEPGPTLRLGSELDLEAIGGTGGAAFSLTRCPLGQAARAQSGRSGQWIDALGLRCGTPTPL